MNSYKVKSLHKITRNTKYENEIGFPENMYDYCGVTFVSNQIIKSQRFPNLMRACGWYFEKRWLIKS